MQKGQHTFGEWRYFQSGKEKALKAIIDLDLEQSLGKAKRGNTHLVSGGKGIEGHH